LGNAMSFQGFHHWAQIEFFVASTGSKGALAVYIRLHFLSAYITTKQALYIYISIHITCMSVWFDCFEFIEFCLPTFGELLSMLLLFLLLSLLFFLDRLLLFELLFVTCFNI